MSLSTSIVRTVSQKCALCRNYIVQMVGILFDVLVAKVKSDACDVFAGSSVGVILPETISDTEQRHFELLLESLTGLLHRQVSKLLLGLFLPYINTLMLFVFSGKAILCLHLCHMSSESLWHQQFSEVVCYEIEICFYEKMRKLEF